MFAPDHARAAVEMARVTKSGGRIGLASWTPEGFIGQMFKVLGQHVPPPPGVVPPSKWGTEAHLRELFGDAAARIDAVERTYMFRYRSAAHFVDVFRSWYGPIHKAFGALGDAGGPALEGDLVALVGRFNQAPDRMLVPGVYLEAVITRS
jgi:hypothetical protein